MVDLLLAGGWLMFVLLGCSIIALTIIVERMWVLKERKIAPADLVQHVLKSLVLREAKPLKLSELANSSPLGLILSRGLQHSEQGVSVMRARMEDQGRQVIIELERYLNTLGSIASAAPLLGLLGTVLGMIQIFAVLGGTPDPQALAGGIAQALLTTAFGLFIAIPCLLFHRYFRRRIDEFAIKLEKESQKLVDGLKAIAPAIVARRMDQVEN
ncbi:MotA/TolQ/ExbB proton channel family protein [Candidatus Berkiella aquae]|uniref:Biopolymer transport protein ExbB n=1 Tax=Candidatus Berkiella aquae TaxID=295108 RepID=A0A0Q9Z1B8_9GAMM|nr:MotA/TolQ/ExbB proton channel family protein [Candidatus Berkiella aquae]MCS5711791.1 MotA/TolQ/ExbB proton channel family protein [Candidatus Berkiella aquae]